MDDLVDYRAEPSQRRGRLPTCTRSDAEGGGRLAAPTYVVDFADITLRDVARVGGKNASLAELFRIMKPQGVGVLDGFATTAEGIDSISLNPDVAITTTMRIAEAETRRRSESESIAWHRMSSSSRTRIRIMPAA